MVRAIVQAGGSDLLHLKDHKASTCLGKAVDLDLGLEKVVEGICGQDAPPAGKQMLEKEEYKEGRECLFLAAKKGRDRVLTILVEACGPQLLKLRYGGQSFLSVAAMNGHLDVVKNLVRRGGRELMMMIDDDTGRSCLWNAAANGHVDVVNFLADEGGKELLLLSHTSNFKGSCFYIATGGTVEESVKIKRKGHGLTRRQSPVVAFFMMK